MPKKKKKDISEEPFIDDVIVDEEVEGATKLAKLRAQLKETAKEKREYLEGWQRAKADLINARKTLEEEKRGITKFAGEAVILDIIPVLDSFDMAFGNREAWENVEENWRNGIEHIYNQLVGVLGTHGVEQLDPLNDAFDPSQHDSVESIETKTKKEDNIVLEVLQKGYVMNGKIIRPAKVKVGNLSG